MKLSLIHPKCEDINPKDLYDMLACKTKLVSYKETFLSTEAPSSKQNYH